MTHQYVNDIQILWATLNTKEEVPSRFLASVFEVLTTVLYVRLHSHSERQKLFFSRVLLIWTSPWLVLLWPHGIWMYSSHSYLQTLCVRVSRLSITLLAHPWFAIMSISVVNVSRRPSGFSVMRFRYPIPHSTRFLKKRQRLEYTLCGLDPPRDWKSQRDRKWTSLLRSKFSISLRVCSRLILWFGVPVVNIGSDRP